MPVLDAIQSWWMAHPIAREAVFPLIIAILFLFLTPLLTPIVETFWKLWTIPPQRLSTWIVKARLSSAEEKFRRLRAIHDHLHFLVFACFADLLSLGVVLVFLGMGSLLGTATIIHWALHQATAAAVQEAVLCLVSFVVAYLSMFLAVALFFEILDAVLLPEETLRKLSSRIEKLRQKLEMDGKGIHTPPHAQPPRP
jgi:hypothetical protein